MYSKLCHQVKESTLLSCMLVAKMDGFPVIFYGVKEQVIAVVLGCDWVFKTKKGSAADYH